MDFKISAKALILSEHGDKLLLYRKRGSNTYYLPGTSIEPGNSAIESLSKYLKTTLKLTPENFFFISTMEKINGNTQEYALFFKVDIEKSPELPNSDFVWELLPLREGIKTNPEYLKEDLGRWLKGKAIFLSTKDKAFSA